MKAFEKGLRPAVFSALVAVILGGCSVNNTIDGLVPSEKAIVTESPGSVTNFANVSHKRTVTGGSYSVSGSLGESLDASPVTTSGLYQVTVTVQGAENSVLSD